MGSIIFLPGILGSRLTLGDEEVWPPTITETIGGYGRIAKLVDPAVEAGEPIEQVCLKPVYRPVLDDLRAIAAGHSGAARRSLHAFGYDWRIDLRDAARAIAGRIDALSDGDRSEIDFVCHSMGNLVARLILESGEFDTRPWFGAIRTLVSLAGPHRGAPTALVRALGLEGTLGLSGKDIKEMAADARYPSLYQLLPQPGIVAAWKVRSKGMDPLDIYDRATAAQLGLHAGNLKKAAQTHAILARNRKPASVSYVYLAGTSEDTWIRINASTGAPRGVAGKDAGDGTVPLWSAVDPTRPHHAAPGVHSEMFRHEQIREVMYRALGARLADVSFLSSSGKPLVSLQTSEIVYATHASVDIMVVPNRPFGTLEGEIVIDYSTDPLRDTFVPFTRLSLSYRGPDVDQLKVRLATLDRPGFYRVSLEGSHALSEAGPAVFAVSETGGAIGAKP